MMRYSILKQCLLDGGGGRRQRLKGSYFPILSGLVENKSSRISGVGNDAHLRPLADILVKYFEEEIRQIFFRSGRLYRFFIHGMENNANYSTK
jgi:hypothetical protein